jgi:hypothetical protein
LCERLEPPSVGIFMKQERLVWLPPIEPSSATLR